MTKGTSDATYVFHIVASCQVMANMSAILQAAGATFDNVVKTTILLEDMSYFPEVNARYGKYFPNNPPARATFAGDMSIAE